LLEISRIALGDYSPEKAGVGGSTPSLATIFQALTDTPQPQSVPICPNNLLKSCRSLPQFQHRSTTTTLLSDFPRSSEPPLGCLNELAVRMPLSCLVATRLSTPEKFLTDSWTCNQLGVPVSRMRRIEEGQ
jgi:hypothetical protein